MTMNEHNRDIDKVSKTHEYIIKQQTTKMNMAHKIFIFIVKMYVIILHRKMQNIKNYKFWI